MIFMGGLIAFNSRELFVPRQYYFSFKTACSHSDLNLTIRPSKDTIKLFAI